MTSSGCGLWELWKRGAFSRRLWEPVRLGFRRRVSFHGPRLFSFDLWGFRADRTSSSV